MRAADEPSWMGHRIFHFLSAAADDDAAADDAAAAALFTQTGRLDNYWRAPPPTDCCSRKLFGMRPGWPDLE